VSVVVVDGYVRVSRVGKRHGERFISPSLQRQQIEGWAALHGVLIAHVFEEVDESGARTDRPLLLEAIERVERGASDGIVVAYLSRFGRSVLAGLQAIERITNAGGTFVSVQDGVDFSTDTGRLLLRLMFSVAEWELDRTRAAWRAAAERAIERGVSPSRAPFGYQRRPDGRLEPHAVHGAIVAELFSQRAVGVSIRDLQKDLVERGVLSPAGNPYWHESTLKRLFHRRAYLGEVRYGSAVNSGAHSQLVDADTWRSAQLPVTRRARRRVGPRPLLDGILRCAGCQRPLQTRSNYLGWSDAVVHYTCGHRGPPVQCPQPAQIRDALVEPYVLRVFWHALSERRPTAPGRLAQLGDQARRRREELLRYRDNPSLPTTLSAQRFAEGLAVRQERLDRAEALLSRGQLNGKPRVRDSTLIAKSWPTMTEDERRLALSEVIECAFVGPKRQASEARIAVYPRGRAPTGLPTRTSVDKTPPFDLKLWPSLRAPAADEEWSDTRIRKELEAFVRDRDRWPSFAEFQRAGLSSLFMAVERAGGQRAWAWELSVPYVGYGTRHWSLDRIRAELQKFVDGRSSWPSSKEFRAAGLLSLREAVRSTGGLRRWADEMGVALPANHDAHRPWTYEHMRAALADFVGNRNDWPTRREFADAGHRPLYVAIQKSGRREQIAADLNLRLPPGRRRIAGYWTDPEIDAALAELLTGRDTWPSRKEFRAARLGTLADVIDLSGRRKWWARRHGVTPTYRWFETTIAKALDEFLEGREHWPTKREFAAADLMDLRDALEKRGDAEVWMARYGLQFNASPRFNKPARRV
jgi:DNA invertase Pin-like site-specific DNA recombinase